MMMKRCERIKKVIMDFETFKTFVKYAEFDKQTFQYYMGTKKYYRKN